MGPGSSHVNSTERMPVPVRLMFNVEFVALLAILMLALLTTPPFIGANVMVNVVDCPGANIVPVGIPVALNPAPLMVTPEIVMSEVPPFVRIQVKELLSPSKTFPNARLDVLASSKSAEPCTITLPPPHPTRTNVSGKSLAIKRL